MKNIKKVGSVRVSKLTFLLVFILLIIIVLAKSCFDQSKSFEYEEKIPTITADEKISNEGKLDVNQERYYYDLGLLPPLSLPELYQQNEKIDYVETEANIFASTYFDKNSDDSLFEDIELKLDFEDISKNILEQEEKEIEKEKTTDIEKEIIADDDFTAQLNDQEFDDISFDDDEFDDFFDDDFDDFDDGFFDGGFASDLSTPFEPILFPPYIQTQEEYDLFNPSEVEETPLDDDFFSDFYIAGESDQALFEDGIYYLSLYVNGDRVGDVETKFEGTIYSISANSLYENISSLLSEYGNDRLFNQGKVYYTIEELQDLGINAQIDVVAFEIYLEFGVDDMPVRYLPVSKVEQNSLIKRNEKYGISDAEVVEKSPISFVSTISLSSSYTYGSLISNPYFNNTLYMNNILNIKDIELNFSNSFSYDFDNLESTFIYRFSDWDATYYIRDKNLRIDFGNLGAFLGKDGTPVGFTIEKNYSYGDGEALKHQFRRRYILESDSMMYIYINEDDEIVKNLRKGEYILQDFPLEQGPNHIKIKIVPNDKSYPIILDEFDVPYDSRLLSLGDYLYGFSASISKSERADDSTSWFALPYFDLKWYEYNLNDFDTRFYLNVGLSHYFTLNSSFALSSEQFRASFSGVLATMSGPFSGNLSLDYKLDYSPKISASLSHVINTFIGDVSATLVLDLPVWNYNDNSLESESELELSLSHSLKNEFGPPLSTSIKTVINNDGVAFDTTFSTNYTPLPGVSFTSSINFNKAAATNNWNIGLQLGFGLTLMNNLTASKSINSNGASSLSLSYKPTNFDSMQFNISGLQYIDNTQPNYNFYYQHIDNYYSALIKHNISNNFGAQNSSISLSSALYYASGLFAISQSASPNFIIIRPEGNFANNPISIGKTNSSNLDSLSPLFGNVVYTKLAANVKNNLIVYGTTKSLYSSGASFSYELTPSSSSGFAKSIASPITYTVSGVLLKSDNTPYEQYSSPIYNLLVDENGVEYLENNEQLYLFTDLDGRFILSDVPVGTYLFDMSDGSNNWYGLYFRIEEKSDDGNRVVLLEDYKMINQDELTNSFEVVSDENAETQNAFGDTFASDYIDIIELQVESYENEEKFWDTIFPPLEENVDDFAFEDTASDWQEALVEEDTFDQDFFENDPAFADTAGEWEDTLGQDLIETVVVDSSQENPNYTYVP